MGSHWKNLNEICPQTRSCADIRITTSPTTISMQISQMRFSSVSVNPQRPRMKFGNSSKTPINAAHGSKLVLHPQKSKAARRKNGGVFITWPAFLQPSPPAEYGSSGHHPPSVPAQP